MDDTWPGPLTDTVRTSLADHGAEMLPAQVEAWLRWIPDNVCTAPGGLGREDPDEGPFDELLPHHWCHLLLIAHRAAPMGPDGMNTEFAGHLVDELEQWYMLHGSHADDYLAGLMDDERIAEDNDLEISTIVLPLAVFAKAVAMLAAISVTAQPLVAAYLERLGSEDISGLSDAAGSGQHPGLDNVLAVGVATNELLAVVSELMLGIRDTAGDIEVVDVLAMKIAETLSHFADLDLVDELADTPRHPEFLGTVGDLGLTCSGVAMVLCEEIEVAEYA